MTTTRIVGPVLLVVMVAAAVFSWTMFTGWGLLASYVGSHEGGLASPSDVEAARAKAAFYFWSMIGLQFLMFASGGFVVRIFSRKGRALLWPTLKNWIGGVLLGAGIDAFMMIAMFYRQTRS